VHVGVFDQHRRLPVAAIGHQCSVGVDLALDAGLVEDLLDVQHLLDLPTDGVLILELQVDVLAQLHAAQAAVGNGPGPAACANLGVGLEREQVVVRDRCHGVHSKP
jgi:hypothetical protein